MHLAYVDEAGNTGDRLDDPDQPIHLIGCLVVDEPSVSPAHQAVQAVAQSHFRTTWDADTFEFHGVELMQGKGSFKGIGMQTRIDAMEDLAAMLAAHQLTYIARGVHKPSLAARYTEPWHPHDVCLGFTLESVHDHVSRRAKAAGSAQHALIVADEYEGRHRTMLKDFARYQQLGTSGWRSTKLTTLVDTIHFVESATNQALQLADCITWLALRRLRIVRGDLNPGSYLNRETIRIWDHHVAPHVARCEVWHP